MGNLGVRRFIAAFCLSISGCPRRFAAGRRPKKAAMNCRTPKGGWPLKGPGKKRDDDGLPPPGVNACARKKAVALYGVRIQNPKRRSLARICALALLVVCGASTAAWPAEAPSSALLGAPAFMPSPARPVGWRGDGTGHYPGATPPTKWSRTLSGGRPQSSGILWMTPIPAGASAPIVVGDRIFFGFDPYGLMCVGKKDGRILWYRTHHYYEVMPAADRKTVNEQAKVLYAKIKEHFNVEIMRMSAAVSPVGVPEANRFMRWEWGQQVAEAQKQLDAAVRDVDKKKYFNEHREWAWAAATPVSDGKFVYMWFSHRVAVCYDLEGNRQWVTLEPSEQTKHDAAEHGRHSSPVLAAGKFIVQYGQDIIALDCKTGKVAWNKPMTARPFFCTPDYSSLVLAYAGRQAFVVDCQGEGFRASDGERGWLPKKDYAGENTTAIVEKNSVFVWDRKGLFQLYIPPVLGPMAQPVPGKSSLWEGYLVGSPLYFNGLVYTVGTKGEFRVFDAQAGSEVYQKTLSLPFYYTYVSCPGYCASPTLAGKYIYIMDNQGDTLILEPGREYKQIAINKIETPDRKAKDKDGKETLVYEQTLSNPVFDGAVMFIRGQQYLYCIGEKGRQERLLAAEKAEQKRQQALEKAKQDRQLALEKAKWRTWTDATGEHQVQAKFNGVISGTVKLLKADGATLEVPLEKLSDEDREWIANRNK
jgi:outer membrane protein assembly factor BamB